MSRYRRRELALLASAALMAAAAGIFGLHKAGLYALPNDRIVVWFSADVDTPTALRRLGEAGTALAGTGPLPGMYRAYVMGSGAPRELAQNAWVLRDPVDGLAQCFGIDTSGPAGTASQQAPMRLSSQVSKSRDPHPPGSPSSLRW